MSMSGNLPVDSARQLGHDMAVPWLQIIQWVPSILDLSRDLLRKSRQPPPPGSDPAAELQLHIAALQENERRQAELIARMAEQSATLSEAVTALHRQLRFTQIAAGVAMTLAVVGCLIAWLK